MPNIEFNKISGRKEIVIKSPTDYCPPYHPNHEILMKRLDKVGQSFDKVLARQSAIRKSPTTHETFFEFEEYARRSRSQLFPK